MIHSSGMHSEDVTIREGHEINVMGCDQQLFPYQQIKKDGKRKLQNALHYSTSITL